MESATRFPCPAAHAIDVAECIRHECRETQARSQELKRAARTILEASRQGRDARAAARIA